MEKVFARDSQRCADDGLRYYSKHWTKFVNVAKFAIKGIQPGTTTFVKLGNNEREKIFFLSRYFPSNICGGHQGYSTIHAAGASASKRNWQSLRSVTTARVDHNWVRRVTQDPPDGTDST